MDEENRREWQAFHAGMKASGFRMEREVDRLLRQWEAEHRERTPLGRWIFMRRVDFHVMKRSLAGRFNRFRR